VTCTIGAPSKYCENLCRLIVALISTSFRSDLRACACVCARAGGRWILSLRVRTCGVRGAGCVCECVGKRARV
jgi:hypothetical protein